VRNSVNWDLSTPVCVERLGRSVHPRPIAYHNPCTPGTSLILKVGQDHPKGRSAPSLPREADPRGSRGQSWRRRGAAWGGGNSSSSPLGSLVPLGCSRSCGCPNTSEIQLGNWRVSENCPINWEAKPGWWQAWCWRPISSSCGGNHRRGAPRKTVEVDSWGLRLRLEQPADWRSVVHRQEVGGIP
jgi:hypothetical protein